MADVNVKNLLVAIVGLIIIGMALPELIESVGEVKYKGCVKDGVVITEKSKDCTIGGVQIEPSLGKLLNDGISLITPAAVIAAAAFGVLGAVKWVMNRAGETD